MTLPLDVVVAGTPLVRVHRADNGALFFGLGPGKPPTCRFDSPSGTFGVLYLGMGLAGAIVETLLRNPRRTMVAYDDLASRAYSNVHCPRDLRLAQLHGAGLQRLGCDNAVSTGPYDPCGAWTDALWAHPDAPDGIAYQSRHDPREICVAIFERPALALIVSTPTPLLSRLPEVAAILGGYGKSVVMPAV